MKFNNAAILPNGSFANTILGVTTSSGCSQNQFFGPAGVTGDSIGNLWIVDSNNNRVMRFTFQQFKMKSNSQINK